jgi:Mg/Co/Ni transporter MgtE
MADSAELAVAYLANHPVEAARVLEALPTAAASALFASVAAPQAAGALSAMLPTAAARILAALPEARAAALAAAANTQGLVAILRHVPPELRTRIIGGLPAPAAIAAQMRLGFPDDTVGAWTDTDIVAVPAATNVAAVLERLRAAPESGLEHVFVVDTAQHLQGCVGMHALLRADERATAGSLARPVAARLAALMPLASVRGSVAWEHAQTLPVVDREQRLIGVLRRSTLTRAQRSRGRAAGRITPTASVTGALAGSYWGIVAGLSTAALSLLPPVRRVQPDDR